MSSIGKIAKNILVWSYERGTIQYDVICALILAFIFLVPRSCFVPNKAQASQQRAASSTSQQQPSTTPLPQ
jgi:hypothetical protein